MGAFAGVFEQNYATVAADTLISYPYKRGERAIRPYLFSNKTHVLPQFRSLFSSTGHAALNSGFLRLANYQAIGLDIRGLINIPIQAILDSIWNECRFAASGTIYAYGWSEEAERFQAFQLPVNLAGTSTQWKELTDLTHGGICLSPRRDEVLDEVLDHYQPTKPAELVRELIICQKSADALLPVAEQVGVGGQVIITTLGYQEGKFMAWQSVVHTFPDYEYMADEIADNLELHKRDENQTGALSQLALKTPGN